MSHLPMYDSSLWLADLRSVYMGKHANASVTNMSMFDLEVDFIKDFLGTDIESDWDGYDAVYYYLTNLYPKCQNDDS